MKANEINYLDEIAKDFKRTGLDTSNYTFETIQGRGRYTKVVAIYTLQGSRSAAAFIDKQTGSMFRAASWSAPAKTRIV